MTEEDELLAEMLATPVGTQGNTRSASSDDFTRKVEVVGDRAVVEVRGTPEETAESTAMTYLASKGEDPRLWEVSGFRSSEWTMANGTVGESVRYTFRRNGAAPGGVGIDELLATIDNAIPKPYVPAYGIGPAHTMIVGIGDMQFGKMDLDGPAGTLHRTIDCINAAVDRFAWLSGADVYINHVHIAWLGDHVEGFNSQGGANTWRTKLTLNEQIRLTRRVMLHAMLAFAPMVDRLTMAAVPGNHGEAVRFMGKGVTRYDDSHDTESLIAVSDAAALNPDRFGHVEFYVPDNDELTVLVDCNGTSVAHAHGHQWSPNKHFDWWRGQAFNRASAMHMADVLLAGHLHHEHIEADGPRTFIGVPALEGESTWWRHKTGTVAAPGIFVALTREGRIGYKEVIHGLGSAGA